MNTLNIPRCLYDQIMDTIGALPAESGGVFARSGDGTIEKYYFDVHAGTGKRFYIPSAAQITAQVNDWLQESELHFGGYIHSHPPGLTTLSPMDIVAAEMTMYKNGLSCIYMLILCENQLYGYQLTLQPEKEHPLVEPCFIQITKSCLCNDSSNQNIRTNGRRNPS